MHTLVLYKLLEVFRTMIILICCHDKTTLFVDKLILDIITSIIPRLQWARTSSKQAVQTGVQMPSLFCSDTIEARGHVPRSQSSGRSGGNSCHGGQAGPPH